MQSNKDHPVIEQPSKRKARRNRRKTECNVIRSKYGCGICGSENLAEQGVGYCEICGLEVDYIVDVDDSWFLKSKETLPKCVCKVKDEWRGNTFYYSRKGRIRVYKCMDCGAVGNNRFCPNSDGSHLSGNFGRHTCWKSWRGQIFCKSCGYRHIEYAHPHNHGSR